MADASSPGVLSTAGFYRRWLGPQLARDQGVDAEQLSQTALRALAQVSLRRRWPGISSVLAVSYTHLRAHATPEQRGWRLRR